MNINYFRHPNSRQHDAWQECQFTSETDLTTLNIQPLVTINGQNIIQQHHSTYLTGKDTCRAHHFAKLIAAAVLAGDCPNVPSAQVHDTVPVTIETTSPADNRRHVTTTRATPRSVLWIDTVHGPHLSAQLYRELEAHITGDAKFQLACLDVLGDERDNFHALNRRIQELIEQLNPALVVIDDIDHFMPFCGVNVATEFCRIVRDVLNHTETSFLFVGYNNLGKKASTTGNLGKYLFIDAYDVFTVSTQRQVTTVRYVRGFDLSNDPDLTQFHFTIGPDNFPHAAEKAPAVGSIMDSAVLAQCVTDVLQPGQTITPDELVTRITARHRQLKQQARSRAILNQALNLDLIQRPDNQQDTYALSPTINTSLTLPPHPSTKSSESSESSMSSVSSKSSQSSESSKSIKSM